MEVTRQKVDNEEIYNFYLKQDNKILEIVFGGNLDLYWSLVNLESNDNYNDSLNEPLVETFTITKENYSIYSLFEELMNDVKEARIFEPIVYENDEEEMENTYPFLDLYREEERCQRLNNELKRSTSYKSLYDGTSITWHSDDENYDVADAVKITKVDDTFVLEFTRPPLTKDKFGFRLPGRVTIRFRNSGSMYNPFNLIFMRMYNKLQEYDPDHHQVDIEELIYPKKLTIKK